MRLLRRAGVAMAPRVDAVAHSAKSPMRVDLSILDVHLRVQIQGFIHGETTEGFARHAFISLDDAFGDVFVAVEHAGDARVARRDVVGRPESFFALETSPSSP